MRKYTADEMGRLRHMAEQVHQEIIGEPNYKMRLKDADDVFLSDTDDGPKYRSAEEIINLLGPRSESGDLITGTKGRIDIDTLPVLTKEQGLRPLTREGIDINDPVQMAYAFPEEIEAEEPNLDIRRARNVGLAARAGDSDGYRSSGTRFSDMPQSLIDEVYESIGYGDKFSPLHSRFAGSGITGRPEALVPGTNTRITDLDDPDRKDYLKGRTGKLFSQWMRQGGTDIVASHGAILPPGEKLQMDHIDPYSKSRDVTGDTTSHYSDSVPNTSWLEKYANAYKNNMDIQETQGRIRLAAELKRAGIEPTTSSVEWMENALRLHQAGGDPRGMTKLMLGRAVEAL